MCCITFWATLLHIRFSGNLLTSQINWDWCETVHESLKPNFQSQKTSTSKQLTWLGLSVGRLYYRWPSPAQSFPVLVSWETWPRFLFCPRHVRVSKWGLTWLKSKSNNRWSVGQSVSVSSTHLGTKTNFFLLSDSCSFFVPAFSDELALRSFRFYVCYGNLHTEWS
jgi:hypothetical protein